MAEEYSIDHDRVLVPNDIDDSGVVDDVLGNGDSIDDIHGLKGLISRALGGLEFKAVIIVVILYNFAYTFYTAFEQNATEETTMIHNNCSCESKDRMFYTIFTFSMIALWLLLFFMHEVYRLYTYVFKHKKVTTHDGGENGDAEDTRVREVGETGNVEDMQSSEDRESVATEHAGACDHEDRNDENMTQKFVSQELLRFTRHIIRWVYNKNINNVLAKHEISKGIHNFVEDFEDLSTSPRLKICDQITNTMKCTLILLQFAARLPVVPLLLLQWLDEYSWKCVFGQFKDYCSDGAKGYYVDQSLVVYGFYMCILLAIVIAAMINSLPTLSRSRPNNKIKYNSKWFLLFRVPRSIYFPNFDFVIVFTLIYTSVLAHFAYSAVIETEVDITSGKLFTINNNWSNVSISGGVSNAVLWQCTEQSNSYFLRLFLPLH